jgi:hypothetical protein
MRGGVGIYKKKIVKMSKNCGLETGRAVVVLDLEDYLAFTILLESVGEKDRDEKLEEVWNYIKNSETKEKPLVEFFNEVGFKVDIENLRVKL